MKNILSAAVLTFFAASSYALELQPVKTADITGMEVPAAAQAMPAAAVNRQYQNLWLSVYTNEAWRESEASDISSGLDVRVRKVSDGMFDVSARAGNATEWLNLSKFGSGFSLSGSGVNLNMNGWSGNFSVSGSVYGEDNKPQFISLSFFGSGDYSYGISGAGLNLNVNRSGISGSYDDTRYSKKALAAVVTLALAAQVESMPAQKAVEEKTAERIWLSISNFGGMGQASASDPFSGIEAEISSFGRNYTADISADGKEERGTISNFFSSSWEYRGGGSRLELVMDSRLQGELASGGRTVKIDFSVNTSFGPGEFNINEEGLNLNVTRNGVNGEIDTSVYPKKLVAMITALAMAMQQPAGQN